MTSNDLGPNSLRDGTRDGMMTMDVLQKFSPAFAVCKGRLSGPEPEVHFAAWFESTSGHPDVSVIVGIVSSCQGSMQAGLQSLVADGQRPHDKVCFAQ